LSDVDHLIESKLVNPKKLLELFNQIEDRVFKFPAINSMSFRRAVESVISKAGDE
jgi:hypothetical protein